MLFVVEFLCDYLFHKKKKTVFVKDFILFN